MDNLDIYNASRSVPQEAQKSFNNGRFRGTDINPMWRIKKLTELFGPCGIGWYIEVLRKELIPLDDEIMASVDINLYIKQGGEWSKPIFGTGGNKLLSSTKSGLQVSDEGYKMAYTDAISVACKALGIGADIYFSADKSSKYAQYYTQNQPDPAEEAYVEAKLTNAPVMATPDQIAAVLALPPDSEARQNAIKYFGANLEKMTASQARLLLARIEGHAGIPA